MIVEILKSIPIVLYIVIFVFIYALIRVDRKKKRKLSKRPKISVIIPCYNDENYIGETIKSILSSYKKTELIVINDKSTDNSKKIIKTLQKELDFIFIDNKKNMGKVKSLNKAVDKASNKRIFFVDSDSIVNEKAFISALERLEEKNVAAVSCPNNVINKGILPTMQQIEYNLIALIRYPANISSCLSLWGSFIGIKKKAFLEVGKFSESAITEDMDLAMKLNEKGWEVKQALAHIYTNTPTKLKDWYKQKVRWVTGGIQSILKHLRVILDHPIYTSFVLVYIFMILFAVLGNILESPNYMNMFDFFKTLPLGLSFFEVFKITMKKFGAFLISNISFRIIYFLYALPIIFPLFKRSKNPLSLLWILPYSLIYMPMMIFVSIIALIKYLTKIRKLKSNERGW